MFWALFVLIIVFTGISFHSTLEERLLARVDASLEQRRDTIVGVYRRHGLEAVVALAGGSDSPLSGACVRPGPAGDSVLARGVGPGCALPSAVAEVGLATLSGGDIGLADEVRYRFMTIPLGDSLVSIGRSLAALDETRAVVQSCLLRALLLAVWLGVVAALLLAHRTRHRMRGWSRALDRVAAGDLAARLPLGGGDDDIDELSARINGLLERLSRTVESMRQVSTDIAHDLKTPLNRLYIDLEEAARRTHSGSCSVDMLDGALEAAREIDGTFEALLSIAQIESGARKERFRDFDLGALVDDAAEVYAPLVEELGGTLVTRVEPADGAAPLLMRGDRALILQLVVNLIENAIRHRGERPVSIELAAECRDGRVRLGVADDGPGIPEAERGHVFRRLYRLERSRTTRGTGLGLSLVKAIAELHCGTVRLDDNRPGLRVGVTFTEHCPLER